MFSDNYQIDDAQIDLSDIDKIIKSADDLDAELFGLGEKKKEPPGKKQNQTFTAKKKTQLRIVDDPLEDLFLSDDEELLMTPKKPLPRPASSRSQISIDDILMDKRDDINDIPSYPKSTEKLPDTSLKDKPKTTSDWLGLTDSPSKSPLKSSKEPTKSVSFEPPSAPPTNPSPVKETQPTTYTSPSKTSISDAKGTIEPMKPLPRRSRKNLLDDLFGDTKTTKPDITEPLVQHSSISLSGGTKKEGAPLEAQSTTPSYAPSVMQRSGRRREPMTVSTPPTLSLEADIDWLTPPSIKGKASKTIEDLKPQAEVSSSNQKKVISNLPDWLGGGKSLNNVEATEKDLQDQPEPLPSVKDESKPVSIIGQLSSLQGQLGAAMQRHQQNMHIYMKALMDEARRVYSDTSTELKSHKTVEKEESNGSPNQTSSDPKDDLLKEKDDQLFDLEVKARRLELELEKSHLKVESLIATHEMAIAGLKTAHGYDILLWESRVERLKEAIEDVQADYEAKLAKFKANEEDLVKEHKERIDALQAQRLAEIQKLGELHRSALEQAATFSVTYPSRAPITLPLKLPSRPEDEAELTEREAALINKERQLEVFKAQLDAEKKEFDEAVSGEKVRKEEREKEMRRVLSEAKLREEANSKELERSRHQLEVLKSQIEMMREEALKEQGLLAVEKLELAAEKARLDAANKLQGNLHSENHSTSDLMKARAELEGALDAAREAQDRAEQERRKYIDLRRAVEEGAWQQKDKEILLESKERHLEAVYRDIEMKKEQNRKLLDDAQAIRESFLVKEDELKGLKRELEEKQREMKLEKLEIVKERLELERKRSQLELLLPELSPSESLTINPNKNYVDPKKVIMRLKAEKELDSYIFKK